MKKYNNPPEKSDFEYFQNFSDFQIVVLCEFELLRKNKKFTRADIDQNPNQLLNNFIINWKENEFKEVSFRDRSSFQVDIQKIIPFLWTVFGDMSDKNHLHIFKDRLTDEESNRLQKILMDLQIKWEKDFMEYKSISILTDEEIIVRWSEEKGMYEEIKSNV
jgi:hypothetical protein